MRTLYLIRHGQSTANAGGVTIEHSAIPLSPLGLAQAKGLAELLDVVPSRILASSYVRAWTTAQPFSEKTGIPVEIHPLLHEFSALDANLLQGMMGEERRPLAQAYWAAADPNIRVGPGAETFLEFDGRVEQFISELATLPDRCVIFGHGIWFGLLFWKLTGFNASDSEGMKSFRRFQMACRCQTALSILLRRPTKTNGSGRLMRK